MQKRKFRLRKSGHACFIMLLTIISLSLQAQEVIRKTDKLSSLPQGAVHLEGYVGEKIDSCIKNGIMAKDYSLYLTPFRERNDDPGYFQGEFWGKWFTSAAMAYHYQPTDGHRAIIDAAAKGLMETQTNDGKLSSYTHAFGPWDIWGRKYALLGLVGYYDQTGDKKALEAAAKSLDNIISVADPGKQKLTETGLSLLEALSSSSILEPVVLIYQRTGEKRYLDFAKHLVSLWSLPNAYTEDGMRLIEDALSGVDPINISSPKAYEQMSCFEGICELYRVTGEKKYLDAVVKYGHKIIEKERMIVGSGSSGELWCDGAIRQTQLLEQPMETCVTATWIKFCYQLLRLTGDPIWADEMERALYNALLGAMVEDANWWAYFSPLAGERMPSPMQVPSMKSSCCVANGPRGLMTAPGWSVMKGKEGPVVNLYTKGTWHYDLTGKNALVLTQETNYPESGEVLITINPEHKQKFTVSLRIPAWSEQTEIRLNGEQIAFRGQGYARLTREWKAGDEIRLKFDMRGRVIKAPGSANYLAIMRGPVILALDNRLVEEKNQNLWLLHDEYKWKHDDAWNIDYALLKATSEFPEKMYIDLKPLETPSEDVWMAFEVPFLYRPTHFSEHEKRSLILCDYSSAGNQYTEENLFRVWMPQPMFLNHIFLEKTWHLLYYTSDERAEIPDLTGN